MHPHTYHQSIYSLQLQPTTVIPHHLSVLAFTTSSYICEHQITTSTHFERSLNNHRTIHHDALNYYRSHHLSGKPIAMNRIGTQTHSHIHLQVHAANVTDLPYPVEIAQFHGTYGGFEYQLNGTAQVNSCDSFVSAYLLLTLSRRSGLSCKDSTLTSRPRSLLTPRI